MAPRSSARLGCGILVALVVVALAPSIAASSLPPSYGHVPQAGYYQRQGAQGGAQYGTAVPPGEPPVTLPGAVPVAGEKQPEWDPRTALPVCGRMRAGSFCDS